MVASKQEEIPFYRGIGRQRGQVFGILAHDIGRTAIHSLREYIVPAAKRVPVDLELQLVAPEIAEVVSGRKNTQSAAKNKGRQIRRKQLGISSRKRTASNIIPTKSAKQTSRSRRDVFTNIYR